MLPTALNTLFNKRRAPDTVIIEHCSVVTGPPPIKKLTGLVPHLHLRARRRVFTGKGVGLMHARVILTGIPIATIPTPVSAADPLLRIQTWHPHQCRGQGLWAEAHHAEGPSGTRRAYASLRRAKGSIEPQIC
jgi:hypothetical protein